MNKKQLQTLDELRSGSYKNVQSCFFVYTSIKSKKSKINPYNLIRIQDKSIELSIVERK